MVKLSDDYIIKLKKIDPDDLPFTYPDGRDESAVFSISDSKVVNDYWDKKGLDITGGILELEEDEILEFAQDGIDNQEVNSAEKVVLDYILLKFYS